jgi:hypothetical protein
VARPCNPQRGGESGDSSPCDNEPHSANVTLTAHLSKRGKPATRP